MGRRSVLILYCYQDECCSVIELEDGKKMTGLRVKVSLCCSLVSQNALSPILSRSPDVLFERILSYFLRRGLPANSNSSQLDDTSKQASTVANVSCTYQTNENSLCWQLQPLQIGHSHRPLLYGHV